MPGEEGVQCLAQEHFCRLSRRSLVLNQESFDLQITALPPEPCHPVSACVCVCACVCGGVNNSDAEHSG